MSPKVLPQAELIGAHNIEIDRSTLKADLVYYMKYKGKPAILNMELQTNARKNIPVRLLQYHAELHAKYSLPVISLVMYPFKTSAQQPPYEVQVENEVLLTFHYKVLGLWTLEAEPFCAQSSHLYVYVFACDARCECLFAKAGSEGDVPALSTHAIWTSLDPFPPDHAKGNHNV